MINIQKNPEKLRKIITCSSFFSFLNSKLTSIHIISIIYINVYIRYSQVDYID